MIVTKGADIAQIDNLSHLSAVEVWGAVWGGKSNRKVANLVPMNPAAFAERKSSGAFQPNATGRPFYYARTETGIVFHPSCDKDYWFEPVYRRAAG